MTIIYGIRAKDSAEYFYIGSTAKSIQRRLYAHLGDVRSGKHCNPHFSNKVRQIGATNVVIELIEECTPKDRYKREYQWIQSYLAAGVKLTNILTAPFDNVSAINGNLFERLASLDIFNALQTYDYGERRIGEQCYDLQSAMLEGVAQSLFERHFNDLLAALPVIIAREVPAPQVEAGVEAFYQQIVGLMPEMCAVT